MNLPPDGYGQKGFRITPELLEVFMLTDASIGGLPDDAQYLRMWTEDGKQTLIVVFVSQEWRRTEEGEAIPIETEETMI